MMPAGRQLPEVVVLLQYNKHKLPQKALVVGHRKPFLVVCTVAASTMQCALVLLCCVV